MCVCAGVCVCGMDREVVSVYVCNSQKIHMFYFTIVNKSLHCVNY